MMNDERSPMLPDVLNPTPLIAEVLPLLPPSRDKLTLIVKGTFDVRRDGRTRLPKAQLPLSGDEHEGDATTPVRYEGDLVPFKPRADLLCVGRAYAPGGQPLTSLAVRFGLLERPKEIRVFGERRLRMLGPTPEIGPPEPFTSMDLSYCRAFGGVDPDDPDGGVCPTNPLGRGWARKAGAQRDRPMPNLEDPRQPLHGLGEPQAPAGFGPIGRTWQPRLALAGTYDERWQRERAPEPPEDFDYRFFNAAPADQQIERLRGDESLWVENLHPELSRLTVRLPGVRIRAFLEAAPQLRDDPAVVGGLRELRLRLDTVWLDMEALCLVLVWRAGLYAAHVAEDGALLIGAERIADEPKPVAIHAAQLTALKAEALAADLEIDEAEEELAG
jgi:hypothetical protein